MRFFKGLIFGLILGAAGYWFFESKSRPHSEAEQNFKNSATQTADHLSDAFRAKMDALGLRPDQIKDELARTGKIARTKAQDIGHEVADAAADAKVVAAIKAKYTVDKELSVWDISVSSTQGHVTLSGTVPNPDDIGRAVALALEVDGVHDVISTIIAKGNG